MKLNLNTLLLAGAAYVGYKYFLHGNMGSISGLLGGGGTWTPCANEGGTCTFPGTATVRYGANGQYITRQAANSILCGNAAMGGDPAVGIAKQCWYR